ncbi:MAG: alpha/beta hydrolase [Motiliproteus sp.]|nr:alpha/beta hydrolase [Motiliproteus sp.]MCW9051815.1 alpha/beta hydrolase [Motiliproteus sp.]
MKQHFHLQTEQLVTDDQIIRYRIYRNKYHPSPRRLLMLHGAGVAGQFTWEAMIEHLTHWSEILVPDLRGMGETQYLDGNEHSYTAEEVLGDVIGLLDQLGWWAVDLAGYSFGGLISMLLKAEYPARVHKQILLEPALLDRASVAEVVGLRDNYSAAAQVLRDGKDAEAGVMMFLDTISPNRVPSPKSEQMIIERLNHRALGFANALDAVTEASKRLDRELLLTQQANVSCFIGGRSVQAMHDYHLHLAHHSDNWNYHSVKGCDHSLPFQKPRQIARLINEDMAQYLDRKPVESLTE